MQESNKLPKGKCGVCGKDIVIRDIRSRSTAFCGRVCASLYKFGKRYKGGSEHEKPNLLSKGKKLM